MHRMMVAAAILIQWPGTPSEFAHRDNSRGIESGNQRCNARIELTRDRAQLRVQVAVMIPASKANMDTPGTAANHFDGARAGFPERRSGRTQ